MHMDADLVLIVFYMCLLGAGVGTFSGLVPGVHVNTLAAILLASSDMLLGFMECVVPAGYGPMVLACCVMSAAVVHAAVDFIPSAFLGVPDESTVMNVLPAHRMLLEGEGMTAVRCAAIGSLVGSVVSLVLAIPMYHLLGGPFGDYLNTITVGVLIIVLCLMVADECPDRRIHAVAVMAMSGAMGVAAMTLDLPFENAFGMEPESMFPLLTGLFGIPSLIMARNGAGIPPQRDDEVFPVSPIAGVKGVVTGSLTGWFPGITSTAGATIASRIFGQEDSRGFISMVASIGTASTMFTFVTLSISGKERSGAMSVINRLLEGADIALGGEAFALMMMSMATASVLAYIVMIKSGRWMCAFAERVDTVLLNRILLFAMVAMTWLFTGYAGLVMLLACAVIGMLPIMFDTNRIHLTGCLIIPVLLFKMGAL